jgi:hypothetical protein
MTLLKRRITINFLTKVKPTVAEFVQPLFKVDVELATFFHENRFGLCCISGGDERAIKVSILNGAKVVL